MSGSEAAGLTFRDAVFADAGPRLGWLSSTVPCSP